jgi:hypothetical protein
MLWFGQWYFVGSLFAFSEVSCRATRPNDCGSRESVQSMAVMGDSARNDLPGADAVIFFTPWLEVVQHEHSLSFRFLHLQHHRYS